MPCASPLTRGSRDNDAIRDAEIIEKSRMVAPNTMPSAPGFCFGPGMFIDPVPADWTEGVVMFAGFREHPDLAMAFHTREMPLWQKALQKKIRKGKRAINGIEGDEVLEKWHELNFVAQSRRRCPGPTGSDAVASIPCEPGAAACGHPVLSGWGTCARSRIEQF